MGTWRSQLKAMLRKNWLLKTRHPFVTLAEVLLPTVVMLLLIAVRTRVDTRIHPAQPNIEKDTLVEVGKGISPSFPKVLELLLAKGEYLAFAPDTDETRNMINILSLKFPELKLVTRIFKDEAELETYITSDSYAACSQVRNCSNPKIKGAVVFHEQGPDLYDYSIRLNHTWAFSGFPDVKSIMDTNGPYINDLEMGINTVPAMQYSFSGFLTLQQVVDSFIIFASQRTVGGASLHSSLGLALPVELPWTVLPSKIRIVPFPTREYTDDEFQSIVKSVMGLLYLLGFLYPISRLISYSVLEKEQKIREGLYMMGLKDEIFHLSWFITYALQFALCSGVITACTMGSLFKYSDKTVVFTYFFLFGLSTIMLSFLISTFFTRAKTAVAVGTLSFLGAFFPYYTVNDESVPMVLKIIASLLSPTAFALGSINFADYERAHVGLRWSNIWRASSGVSFVVCLLMMLLDSMLYCIIGLYFDKVLPRENGVRYKWNFIFGKCFGRKKNKNQYCPENTVNKILSDNITISSEREPSDPIIESISLEMRQQELDGRCMQVRDLHKVYASRKGNCCAVNSLRLSLYENQILALLGHNGAGKSTTISMLVGLLPPTSGDALIFGKNILTNMDEIRKELGVCPQHDILFPELTVKEHLEMFAVLKGVKEDSLERTVADMADEVGLSDKINTLVRALSGGMKRKLSLGIALIGNSKVIVLDEPTSGMDPYSMRLTWQLIKKIKKGRIILLTTHSMDEAELIAYINRLTFNVGFLCLNSSIFLKHHYGVGYTLTLVKSSPTVSVAASIVHRHIPSATCVSEVGNEISFKLPLASSPCFEDMFREIESCMKRSVDSSRINEIEGLSYPGIQSYGISITTLEEVFLRVAGANLNIDESVEEGNIFFPPDSAVSRVCSESPPKGNLQSKLLRGCNEVAGLMVTTIAKACSWVAVMVWTFVGFISMQCCCCCIISRSTFWRHCKALFIKRARSAGRDRKTVAFQLIIPVVFLLFGLLFLQLKPHPDQNSITLTTAYFNPLLTSSGGGGPIPFDLSHPIANEVAEYIEGGWIQPLRNCSYKFPDPEKALADATDAAGPTLGPTLLSMSKFLMSSFNQSYQSRYGAIVMDGQYPDGSLGYTVLHNSTCQHAGPIYINVMNAAILRLATRNKNMTIRTHNHPLPTTKSQHLQRHDLDAFSAAIIVNIAFSFIPASFAVPIVKEREVKAKHQQLISGVSVFSYWVSTYIWDFVSFLFPSTFAMILFYIFGLEQFIGIGRFVPTVIMFLEYGLAIASSTYCLTFFFSEHSMAQNVVLLVHFFTGLILMVISFVMGLIPATASANSSLKNYFRLSPGFCFSDGLASLALLRQGMKDKSSHGVLDWNVTGASICYLGLESIFYFLVTLGLELLPVQKIMSISISDWWQNSKVLKHSAGGSGHLEPLLKDSPDGVLLDIEDDVDVQNERARVLSGSTDNAICYLRNLRKVYPGTKYHGPKVAVQSLTFSVQAGECFGFLGTNGAGKTTTLSMLSGEETPTSGTAFVFGKDIVASPKAIRQHIGYCPQFDALFEHLTVKEHLELYARIKGVVNHRIDNVVTEKMVEFDLLKHANKPSFTLSGGNKRKLSVAIAMIGDPPIVILDEPSTGMDPVAKRFMWDVISRLSTRRGKTAVILTTHSMNEAQALCTRIGIMVGGRLRCIGSPQHLKTRFGNHLELEVKPNEVRRVDLENFCQMIQQWLFNLPSHPRSLLGDLEVCIGVSDSIIPETASASEISLSVEMIKSIAQFLGNEGRVNTLVSPMSENDGRSGEQLLEQLFRDGGIPLPIFAEWWLSKENFSALDSFIQSSFPGATFKGCNGLSIKYQLPFGEGGLSLADAFGYLERNRNRLGIAEYSVGQSTLETIFNHFAANSS
ncbi:PREDICTED: ABC transporter A family member 1 [Tarenaya hassleriana]|uniref:ABC transporter A family member 1 n=1 Tax=Tarenaya hassleriana TaxID=28532 RepID=UPI00053CA8A1|nr:PREDICTED: ABC transporter A family member 1 [Tarenaya hassleriana]